MINFEEELKRLRDEAILKHCITTLSASLLAFTNQIKIYFSQTIGLPDELNKKLTDISEQLADIKSNVLTPAKNLNDLNSRLKIQYQLLKKISNEQNYQELLKASYTQAVNEIKEYKNKYIADGVKADLLKRLSIFKEYLKNRENSSSKKENLITIKKTIDDFSNFFSNDWRVQLNFISIIKDLKKLIEEDQSFQDPVSLKNILEFLYEVNEKLSTYRIFSPTSTFEKNLKYLIDQLFDEILKKYLRPTEIALIHLAEKPNWEQYVTSTTKKLIEFSQQTQLTKKEQHQKIQLTKNLETVSSWHSIKPTEPEQHSLRAKAICTAFNTEVLIPSLQKYHNEKQSQEDGLITKLYKNTIGRLIGKARNASTLRSSKSIADEVLKDLREIADYAAYEEQIKTINSSIEKLRDKDPTRLLPILIEKRELILKFIHKSEASQKIKKNIYLKINETYYQRFLKSLTNYSTEIDASLLTGFKNYVNTFGNIFNNSGAEQNFKEEIKKITITTRNKFNWTNILQIIHEISTILTILQPYKKSEAYEFFAARSFNLIKRLLIHNPFLDNPKNVRLLNEKISSLPENFRKSLIGHIPNFSNPVAKNNTANSIANTQNKAKENIQADKEQSQEQQAKYNKNSNNTKSPNFFISMKKIDEALAINNPNDKPVNQEKKLESAISSSNS